MVSIFWAILMMGLVVVVLLLLLGCLTDPKRLTDIQDLAFALECFLYAARDILPHCLLALEHLFGFIQFTDTLYLTFVILGNDKID